MSIAEIVDKYGYVREDIDPSLNLIEEIRRLREEKKAIILAHYYQEAYIQEIADYVGDSLGLSRQAERTDADIILFAGVHFMAETAKILNPEKKVLIPDLNAGCSLEESCSPDQLQKFKMENPEIIIVTYINSSARVKALSDIVVTSSNAVPIVSSLSDDRPILFTPDKHLGNYVKKKTGKNILIWDGACIVHEIFDSEKLVELKKEYPEAKLIAHPECQENVLEIADFIGSTSELLKFVVEDETDIYIVATEPGILYQMRKKEPYKTFIPAPTSNLCACNNCPYMKLNTIEKIYLTLKYELHEIKLPEALIEKAYIPIKRMMDLSEKLKI